MIEFIVETPLLLWMSAIMGMFWGALFFRYRGGGAPDAFAKYLIRPSMQIAFSLPYIVMAFSLLPFWPGLIISALTVIFVSKGHGNSMDLGTMDNSLEEPEWYEWMLKPLKGKVSEYLYDAVGLAVSGLSYTLPIGVVVANPASPLFVEGIALALSGALKAPAYMIAKALHKKQGWDMTETKLAKLVKLKIWHEYGEGFTGAALWAVAVPILFIILGRA